MPNHLTPPDDPPPETDAGETRHLGTVRFYRSDPGYGWGFIVPDDPMLAPAGRDLFVHRTAVEALGVTELECGQRASFVLGQHNGRPLAIELELIS